MGSITTACPADSNPDITVDFRARCNGTHRNHSRRGTAVSIAGMEISHARNHQSRWSFSPFGRNRFIADVACRRQHHSNRARLESGTDRTRNRQYRGRTLGWVTWSGRNNEDCHQHQIGRQNTDIRDDALSCSALRACGAGWAGRTNTDSAAGRNSDQSRTGHH